jgi:hypothetical protein
MRWSTAVTAPTAIRLRRTPATDLRRSAVTGARWYAAFLCLGPFRLLAASDAVAAPQWNTALVAGVAGVGDGSTVWGATQFYGGIRGDVLFLRRGPRSFGLGPSLELSTAGFSDVRTGAGATALLPLGDLWGIAFEPGGYVRSSAAGASPGLSGRAWFGIQTYNYQGAYSPRGGIAVGYAHDLGDSDSHAIVVVAQVDGLVLALPFVLLYESFRGRSRE